MFKHSNSNILIHLGFSREWCKSDSLKILSTVCKLVLKCNVFLKNIHQPETCFHMHATDDTWRLKFSQFRKKCFAFMGIVQYKSFRTFRKIINKSSEIAQASP